jgi:catalase
MKLAIWVQLLAFVTAASAVQANEDMPEQLIDALNAVFGKHGVRASHAKGICVKGEFRPTATAKDLTKATPFAMTVPVLGRFSMGGGKPNTPDATKAAPRGFALRLEDAGGSHTDLVAISTPMFFASTPDQMLAFLKARAPSADGKPDQEKIKTFAAANPNTTRQGAWLSSHPVPASYAGVNYWTVHAYTLTNADAKRTTVKFKLTPLAGEAGLTDEEAKARPADFYRTELEDRLNIAPVEFSLTAIIGKESDPTDDPSAMWPEESRRTAALGTVSITSIADDTACDATTFDPFNLAEGISAPAHDPIFAVRSPAYAVSLSRRQ